MKTISRIIVFGDSIAYGKWDPSGGWVQRLREFVDVTYNLPTAQDIVQVHNVSIPGETSLYLKTRFESELLPRLLGRNNEIKSSAIILAIGLNDICHKNARHERQLTQSEQQENFLTLISVARKYTDNIFVLGFTPIDQEKTWKSFPLFENQFLSEDVAIYEKKLADFLLSQSVVCVPVYNLLDASTFTDGIHPNGEGHDVIFEQVKSALINSNCI